MVLDDVLNAVADEIIKRVLAGLEKALNDEADAKAAQDQFDEGLCIGFCTDPECPICTSQNDEPF